MLRLSDAKKSKKYIIQSIDGDLDQTSRFGKLGFLPGREVELRRKGPIFGNPLLFEVDHSQFALTKTEAAMILAEERE